MIIKINGKSLERPEEIANQFVETTATTSHKLAPRFVLHCQSCGNISIHVARCTFCEHKSKRRNRWWIV